MKSSLSLSSSRSFLPFSAPRGGRNSRSDASESLQECGGSSSFPPDISGALPTLLFSSLAQSADLSVSSAIKSMYKWALWKSRAFPAPFHLHSSSQAAHYYNILEGNCDNRRRLETAPTGEPPLFKLKNVQANSFETESIT